MSVTTTADEKLEETRLKIDQAIENLSEIVVDRVWGHDDFSSKFQDTIANAFYTLIEIRKDLH